MIKNTAVLLFANSSAEEQLQKTIPNSIALFDVLNRKTLETVRRSGLPYFHFTEKEQQGLTFGERFTNAIQHVFDEGYENIITIGNDTPQLKENHLLRSAALLNQKKLVLGPSQDGGFYLMGIRRSHFEPASFLKLPWQTSGLLAALSRLLTKKADVEIHQLKPLKDIDRLGDIKVFLNSYRSLAKDIKKVILALLQLKKDVITNYLLASYHLVIFSFHNKGSPVFSHSLS
ncbi:hypothetical protein BH23BAC2_BH23BAC2_03030 [soil metagenome]